MPIMLHVNLENSLGYPQLQWVMGGVDGGRVVVPSVGMLGLVWVRVRGGDDK